METLSLTGCCSSSSSGRLQSVCFNATFCCVDGGLRNCLVFQVLSRVSHYTTGCMWLSYWCGDWFRLVCSHACKLTVDGFQIPAASTNQHMFSVAFHQPFLPLCCIVVSSQILSTLQHDVLLSTKSLFYRRYVSEFFMIRDCTRIPNIMWFEYTAIRKESR